MKNYNLQANFQKMEKSDLYKTTKLQRNINRAINQRVCKPTLISAAETAVSAAETVVSAANDRSGRRNDCFGRRNVGSQIR